MINAMWLERSSGAKAPGATKRKPAPLDAGRQRGLIARIPNHPFYGWRRFIILVTIERFLELFEFISIAYLLFLTHFSAILQLNNSGYSLAGSLPSDAVLSAITLALFLYNLQGC